MNTNFRAQLNKPIIVTIALLAVCISLTLGVIATTSPVNFTLSGNAQATNSFTVTSNRRNGFDIVLTTQPTSETTITITSSDTGAATAAKSTLTFTPQNWSVAQIIEITPIIDADNRNERVTFTFANGSETLTRVVQVNDTISGGLLVSPATGITVNNGEASSDMAITLEVKPTAPVTIKTTGSLGIDTQSVTFTAENFNVPKLLKFDPTLLPIGVTSVTYTVIDASSAPEYQGLSAIRTITVTGGVGGTGETIATPEPTVINPTQPIFGDASPDVTVSTISKKTNSVLIRTGGAD
jgi:hypothetical protein